MEIAFPMPYVSFDSTQYKMPGLEDRASGQALHRVLPSFFIDKIYIKFIAFLNSTVWYLHKAVQNVPFEQF